MLRQSEPNISIKELAPRIASQKALLNHNSEKNRKIPIKSGHIANTLEHDSETCLMMCCFVSIAPQLVVPAEKFVANRIIKVIQLDPQKIAYKGFPSSDSDIITNSSFYR